MRLRLERRVDDATVVEAELELRCLDRERAAREPPLAKSRGEHGVELELLEDRGIGLAVLRLPVREPCVRVDHRAVEERLVVAGRHLDGDAQAILVGPQRAGLVGELERQHRRDEPWHVGRERTLGGAVVEGRAGRDEVRDVGDVHPGPDPARLAAEGERVVEVLRRFGVDREGG